jgi:hypothetical protein
MRGLWAVALGVSIIGGCGSSSEDEGGGGPNGPSTLLVGAKGITLTQVAMYQGPKRLLMQGGLSQTSDVPLVAGRPGWLRVFHQTDANYDGGPVFVRLEIKGHEPILAEVPSLTPATTVEEDAGSGIGFDLPGEMIHDPFEYSVGFYRDLPVEEDNPAARWGEAVAVQGKQNTLRVRLVPYQYNYDGSGRLPNTSPEQVEKFRERFLGMYPVSNVDITVHDPVPWSGQLQKNGSGWQQLGLNLSFSIKSGEGLGDDVYYYGIFNPADTLGAYCGTGCLLGVTLLNNDPPETGTAQLRLALGVGFDAQAPDVSVHETGHAHGRNHVQCGLGVDPSSVDQAYPHDPKTLGPLWSWDVVNKRLLDPAKHTDIMGYCNNQWISDYQYGKLFIRTQNVNLPKIVYPNGPPRYDIIAFDGLGAVHWTRDVQLDRPAQGTPLDVTLRKAGKDRSVRAAFYAYDHLSGGWIFVPAGEADEVTAIVDGKTVTAKRPGT